MPHAFLVIFERGRNTYVVEVVVVVEVDWVDVDSVDGNCVEDWEIVLVVVGSFVVVDVVVSMMAETSVHPGFALPMVTPSEVNNPQGSYKSVTPRDWKIDWNIYAILYLDKLEE